MRRPPGPTLFPYTTLFRSLALREPVPAAEELGHHPSRVGALGEARSEEHTSELQSRGQLVCRLLLEKKKTSCTGGRSAAGSTGSSSMMPISSLGVGPA